MTSTMVRVTFLFCLFLLFIPNLICAELKTFVKEYTYQASEVDSKVSCRAIALEQVKRLLLEELGTYLESHTEIVNYQLTKDQVTALTAGVVQTQVLKEKWDGQKYWLQAEIKANPDDVIKEIDFIRKDREENKELEDANNRADAALKEVEKLRNQLKLAKRNPLQIARYDEAINELSATDWYRKGISFIREGNYDEAITANTKAIQLNPKYALAYVNRSFAYLNLRNYQKTLEDSNKAIELNPKYSRAYVNRGAAYRNLGNYRQAIEDSNKAIELDPKNSMAYVSRAIAYSQIGNYQQTLEDSNKAIELNPKNSMAYVSRAFAYSQIGNYQQALEDSNKAIELNPKNSMAYVNRGLANSHLGNHKQALEDSNKAIELDPKNSIAYANRGFTYQKLGNNKQSINDYKTAARLGHKKAQSYLKLKGISW